MIGIAFTVDGVEYELDMAPDKFTAAELNAIEEQAGLTVTQFGRLLRLVVVGDLSSRMLSALAWTAVRRGGVDVGWREFVEDLRILALVQSMRIIGDPVEIERATTQAAQLRLTQAIFPDDPMPTGEAFLDRFATPELRGNRAARRNGKGRKKVKR